MDTDPRHQAYDPKDDLIDLDLDGLDHMIHHPRELYVENGLNVASLEIVDEEGVSQIVKFKGSNDAAGAAAVELITVKAQCGTSR
jgi:hypothetical protein